MAKKATGAAGTEKTTYYAWNKATNEKVGEGTFAQAKKAAIQAALKTVSIFIVMDGNGKKYGKAQTSVEWID